MSSPPSRSPLAAIDPLFRRYDGPAPPDELLAAMTGEPANPVRLRAISREIDRLVLKVGRLIAIHGDNLRRSLGSSSTEGAAIAGLSAQLARYRTLGSRLAGRPTPARE